jgi:peroxiredoxin
VKIAGMTLEIRLGRVVVTEVAKGSPAERAGILPLDVLLVANDRSLVDLDPISPQQVLGLLQQEHTLRTRLVLGRGAGTLSVDLPRDPGGTPAAPQPPLELRPGVEAPLFTGRDLQGRDVSLKDLRGRLVLIDFWASTCPPCARAVIPLRRISEQHEGKVQIVGVSLDEDRKAFEAFVYNQHLPGIQIFDGTGWRGTIARLYGVPANGIPHYVLLDEAGRIAAIGDLARAEEAIARLIREAR